MIPKSAKPVGASFRSPIGRLAVEKTALLFPGSQPMTLMVWATPNNKRVFVTIEYNCRARRLLKVASVTFEVAQSAPNAPWESKGDMEIKTLPDIDFQAAAEEFFKLQSARGLPSTQEYRERLEDALRGVFSDALVAEDPPKEKPLTEPSKALPADPEE